MRPNRSTAACDGRLGVGGVGDIELDGQEVILLAEAAVTSRAAGGGDDGVAGREGGLGDVDAHATAGAGDEPNLLVSHLAFTSSGRSVSSRRVVRGGEGLQDEPARRWDKTRGVREGPPVKWKRRRGSHGESNDNRDTRDASREIREFLKTVMGEC